MQQRHQGQQSNDFQMLQQHIMLKQHQERQMQQQFQELGDARQHINYVNQQSMMDKQASGPQFPPLINRTPSHDSSHMFTVGHTSPVQGFSNAVAFSQDQSQPLDESSYGNCRIFPGEIVPSDQDLDSLDPLEQKILFNVDDNSWSNTATGSLEHADHLSAFSSLQSGSWSALMQSAVAETTSSDTGLQEEWSGLSYQNPDLSADNQPSNFVDGVNQHTNWADNNLQSASSLCSKPELLFSNSNSSGFSGFHQLGTQISFKQKDGLHPDRTHNSFQQSPKNSSNWLDCSVSSFFDPNATGETSQHMLDLLHKANKSTVSNTSSGTSIPSSTSSQFQSQHENVPPVARQSPQEALDIMGSRFSNFTPASSQNLSFTMSPPDVWTNVPSQKKSSGIEPQVKLDFEAFGRSLKHSHVVPPQNYSFLNQTCPVKNEKTDLRRVSEKRSGVDSDSSNHQPMKALSQRDTSLESVKFAKSGSQCDSNNSNVATNRTEQSKISLQMAPTWFNHYGTLKDEKIWSMNEPKTAKNTTQQFFLGKPLGNLNSSMMQVKSFDASKVNSGSQSTSTNSVAVTNLAPPHILTPNVTDHNLAVLRPKKRKIGPFELLPWHRAITQGSLGLQNISTAELEWAKAVNRLVEKVDHEAQIAEPILRPKKRLVWTTQLMQQLFRPAPVVILVGDATKNCISTAYFAARFALADACSLTSNCSTPCDISDMSFEKSKSSGRIRDHDFSKSVEDVSNRSKWLEELLLSLDSRVSFLDVRVESLELDKFSVINRLAKFHSRGPPGAAETSTSSGPNVNTQRMFLQRYVKAHPMPKTVPSGAKCMSL